MAISPIHPGRVAWTGENPGIYLKEQQDGPWTGLATFFRITWSPFGRGKGVLVLDRPNVEKGPPEAWNFCISDNEELANYLVVEFFSKFASFRVSPGINAISYLPLTEARREGDCLRSYAEIVKSKDFEVVMTWKSLGRTLCGRHAAGEGPDQSARNVQPVPRLRRCVGHG